MKIVISLDDENFQDGKVVWDDYPYGPEGPDKCLSFYAGENENGYVSDRHDPEFEKLLRTYLGLGRSLDTGAAEAYHMIFLNDLEKETGKQWTAEELWGFIKERLGNYFEVKEI